MKSVLITYILTCILCISCTNSTLKETKAPLRIVTASNMHPFAKALIDSFVQEKTPQHKIELIQNGSGTIYHQIKKGAPYHIFLSAHQKYTEDISQARYSTPLMSTALCIVYRNNIPIEEWKKGTESAYKIAIAQPSLAPFGQYAVDFLKSKHLYEPNKAHIIWPDNIQQVNLLIQQSVIDIGFTSASSLHLFDSTYQHYKTGIQATQYLVSINQHPLQEAFIQYLKSEKAIKLMKAYGHSSLL